MTDFISNDHIDGTPTVSHSFDNIFGGNDTFANGQKLGYTVPNISGGHDLFDSNGNPEGRTIENTVMGGQDIYDNNGNKIAYTQENVIGGHDLYDANGNLLASSNPNVLGGEDVNSNGHLVSSSYPTPTSIDTVMYYSDPLAHIGSYVLPPLIF